MNATQRAAYLDQARGEKPLAPVDLAAHILDLAADAHFSEHPKWEYIVAQAANVFTHASADSKNNA